MKNTANVRDNVKIFGDTINKNVLSARHYPKFLDGTYPRDRSDRE
jgi:hypothetical protein